MQSQSRKSRFPKKRRHDRVRSWKLEEGRRGKGNDESSPKGVVHRWRILRSDPSSCWTTRNQRSRKVSEERAGATREERGWSYSSFVVDEHLDMSQRLSIQHEVLSLSNRIVDVEVLLTEQILIEVELFEVPGKRTRCNHNQLDASNSTRTRSSKKTFGDSRDNPTQRRKHQGLIHR